MPVICEQKMMSTIRNFEEDFEQFSREIISNAMHRIASEIEKQIVDNPESCSDIVSVAKVAKAINSFSVTFDNQIDEMKLAIQRQPDRTAALLEEFKKLMRNAFKLAFRKVNLDVVFRTVGTSVSKSNTIWEESF